MGLLEKAQLSMRKGRFGRTRAAVLGVSLAAALGLGGAAIAFAAGDGTVYPENVIETTTPANTTVNLYDYFVNDSDPLSIAGDGGVNAGHAMKFNDGDGVGINNWSGENGMPVSYMKSVLSKSDNADNNGYPEIKAGTYSVNETSGTIAEADAVDLGYLFNDATHKGKTKYSNVGGLFEYDELDGYYKYDSLSNYAYYNKTSNSFNVYDSPAVHANTATGTLGEFFPFNSPTDVFSQSKSGGEYTLTAKGVTDSNIAQTVDGSTVTLNHHFGLSAETSFVQPVNGQVTYNDEKVAATYELSGDDDMWVYIDGVLVGDLGGIHDSTSLKIDFSTGEVKTYSTALGEGSATAISTTLKDLYKNAQGASFDESAFSGNTFADYSEHTLKLFYLERGADASDLSLKFNLRSQPAPSATELDAWNAPVVTAELSGGSWDVEDSFDFMLQAEAGTPMPEGSTSSEDSSAAMLASEEQELAGGNVVTKTITATKDAHEKVRFGGIKYDKEGVFEYTISQVKPAQLGAFAYSSASYKATVTVKENVAEGKLYIDSVKLTKLTDDSGAAVPEASQAVDGNNATFTNTSMKPVLAGSITRDGKTYDIDNNLVSPGDEITYTITYKNFATDADGSPAAAQVVLIDELPHATTYVEGSAGDDAVYDEAHHELKWTIDGVDAQGTGTVSFKVKVIEANYVSGHIIDAASATIAGIEAKSNEVSFDIPRLTVEGASYSTSVSLGDELTYTISFPVPKGVSKLNVYDKVPDGTSYVDGSVSYDVRGTGSVSLSEDGYFTWGLDHLEAGSTVTVSYKAKVESAAFNNGSVTNAATVESAGDYPAAGTNPTSRDAKLADLTVGAVNNGGNAGDEFSVTVKLADKDGKPVSGTFGKDAGEATFNEQGETTFTLKGGEQKVLQLPHDISYTVTQLPKAGYTTQYTRIVNGNAKSTTTDQITGNLNPWWSYGVTITNQATEAQPALLDTASVGMAASISGRNWASGDSFGFTLAAADDATQAVIDNGAITGANAQGEDQALTTSAQVGGASGGSDALPFNFGKVKFKKAGTYTFKVTQDIPAEASKAAGITYDTHTLTLRVAVTANDDNTLSAVSTTSGSTTFENTFRTTVDYSAVAGVEIAKTLNGHAMTAGQFAFTVAPDAAAAKKLGLDSGTDAYKATAEDAGDTCVIDLFGGKNIVFGPEDAGAYTFTIAETTAPGAGYTNDSDARTVTIDVSADSSTGVVTVTTTAKKGDGVIGASTVKSSDAAGSAAQKVTVPFTSSYAATGTLAQGAIDATTTLTGREMADEEFKFAVTNVSDAANKELASGTNAGAKAGVAGKVTFSAISYSTELLEADVKAGLATKSIDSATGNATYTLHYKVAEKTEQVSQAGVTPGASAFAITVTVADNGAGTLTPTVAYPEGTTSLAFTNSYSSKSATINLSGTKKLAMGDPSLSRTLKAGEFSFAITSEDGAPLPATTTTTNDAAGNVNFGSVTYTQDSLAGATASENGIRTKTFTYQVAESGKVAGVTNDKDNQREFSVVVSEDTSKAQITAYLVDSAGNEKASSAFCFTNTYSVSGAESSTTDSIQVNTEIDGRNLNAGEFTFELVEGDTVVATGTNAADGSVSLDAITYTKPGTYSYVLRQAIPADASKLAGVEYDTLSYKVVATVTDNGDGKLSATHQLVDAQGQPVSDSKALFQNIYVAQPISVSIGAGVVLDGKDLTAGQFTYTLTDAAGSVVATAKNAADGQVNFPELTYSDADMVDAEGKAQASKTFTYKLAQQNDEQENITYDDSTFIVNVTVTDSGTGTLSAQVAFGKDEVPVFHNSYAKKIDVPTAATGLVYNGNLQVVVAESADYTLSGDLSATEAGSYKTTVTPKRGYTWADGTSDVKVVEWSIAKAKLTATYAGETITTGETPKLEVSYNGFVNGENAETAYLFTAPTIAIPGGYGSWEELPAGTYSLTPAEGAANDYDITYQPGTLTVENKNIAVPAAATGLVYNGSEQTGVAEGEGYTLSGDAKATNAGSYTATATPAKGYAWPDGSTDAKTIEWSIAKANPAYTVPMGLAATYGQTLVDVDLPAGFTWQSDPGTSVGAVGANTFKVKFTPSDTANYNVAENIEVTITVSEAAPEPAPKPDPKPDPDPAPEPAPDPDPEPDDKSDADKSVPGAGDTNNPGNSSDNNPGNDANGNGSDVAKTGDATGALALALLALVAAGAAAASAAYRRIWPTGKIK